MQSSGGFKNARKLTRKLSSTGNTVGKEISLPGNEIKKASMNKIGEALKKRYIEPAAHAIAKDNYFKK